MTDVSIITYGGSGILREVFNAIAIVAGGPTYASLLKIALMFGLAWTCLQGTLKRQHIQKGVAWLVAYYVTFNILLLPKVTVHIMDRVYPNQHPVIANVPWGIAVPASIGSHLRDGLTQAFEAAFSLPDNLQYSKTGMVMASRLVQASSQFRVTDPAFQQALQYFVNQCVFYNVLLHQTSLKALVRSNDIWQLVSQHASPARAFLYHNKIITCQQGAKKLSNDWHHALGQAASAYGARLFPGKRPQAAKAALLAKLPLAYHYVTGLSLSASHILQQNVMMNAIEAGPKSFATKTNASAALQSYAFTKAQAEKRNVYRTLGQQAAYWLPVMQTVFAALIYGCFLLVLPFLLLPIGWAVLRNYFLSLLWIELWAPLFAIINLIMGFYAAKQGHVGAHAALSLINHARLNQAEQDIGLVAGYLSMTVPFLSYGLITRGIAPAFSHMSQLIGGVAQHAAQSSSVDETTGNLSLGNVQFDNNSGYLNQSHHWNTQGALATGQMSTTLDDGAMFTRTASGGLVVSSQGALSNTAANIHLADSVRHSASEHASASLQSAESELHAASVASTAGLRQLMDYQSGHGASAIGSTATDVSDSQGVNHAVSEVQHLVERFANDHHISAQESERVLGTYFANYSAHAGASSTASAAGRFLHDISGLSGSLSTTLGHRRDDAQESQTSESEMMQDAHSFDAQTGFSGHVESALRAVSDQNFRQSSEANQRFADSVSEHFESANSLRQEAQTNLSQAESFQQMAAFAKEEAASIDYNASSAFVGWMAEQPAPGEQGKLGTSQAEAILNHSPELAQQYAKDYVTEQTQTWENNWQDQHFRETVQQDAKSANKNIEPESGLDTVQAIDEGAVQAQQPSHTVAPSTRAVAAKAQALAKTVSKALNAQQRSVRVQGQALKKGFQKSASEVSKGKGK